MEVWCSCYWIQYRLNNVKTSDLKHVYSRVTIKYVIKLPHQHLKHVHTITHINQRTWVSTYIANSFTTLCFSSSLITLHLFKQEFKIFAGMRLKFTGGWSKSRIFTEKPWKKRHFYSLQMYKPFLLCLIVRLWSLIPPIITIVGTCSDKKRLEVKRLNLLIGIFNDLKSVYI